MQIYVAQSGQQKGPFSEDQIQSMLSSGSIRLTDEAWHDGLSDWVPLHQVLKVCPPIPQTAQPPPLPPLVQVTRQYNYYSEVPFYRKQWFFWMMYFPLTPVALGLLLSGDIYYKSRGEVKAFGTSNKVVAGIIALLYFIRIVGALIYGIQSNVG